MNLLAELFTGSLSAGIQPVPAARPGDAPQPESGAFAAALTSATSAGADAASLPSASDPEASPADPLAPPAYATHNVAVDIVNTDQADVHSGAQPAMLSQDGHPSQRTFPLPLQPQSPPRVQAAPVLTAPAQALPVQVSLEQPAPVLRSAAPEAAEVPRPVAGQGSSGGAVTVEPKGTSTAPATVIDGKILPFELPQDGKTLPREPHFGKAAVANLPGTGLSEAAGAVRAASAAAQPVEAIQTPGNRLAIELLQGMELSVRPASGPVSENAAAALLFDRRALLEANARFLNVADKASAAVESVDRHGVGLESSEQVARPLLARAVAPVLLARDMSAVAERIEAMLHRPGSAASVNLSLGDLGSVEINVRMEARQAHVQFLVHDPAVREVLEQQLPRLRAMLEESGLRMGDVTTGLPGRSDEQQASRRHGPARVTDVETDDGGDSAFENAGLSRHPGPSEHLLDAFV